jgi:hypothetical protein
MDQGGTRDTSRLGSRQGSQQVKIRHDYIGWLARQLGHNVGRPDGGRQEPAR